MNLHVKYPIFSAKDDEDAESHLLQSSEWMNSKGITEKAMCHSFNVVMPMYCMNHCPHAQ